MEQPKEQRTEQFQYPKTGENPDHDAQGSGEISRLSTS